jgi:hypothetical protein
VFYICSGAGGVTVSGKTAELFDGVGVFIPANLQFSLENTGDKPLQMIVIGETIPAGFAPRKDMLVRDENVIPIRSNSGHWVNAGRRLFNTEDRSVTLMNMGPVFRPDAFRAERSRAVLHPSSAGHSRCGRAIAGRARSAARPRRSGERLNAQAIPGELLNCRRERYGGC